MSSQTEILKNPSPGIVAPLKPFEPTSFENLYVLHFIHKASFTHIQQKVFKGSGDFQGIVQRAKIHCEITGMRFVFVKPFISDLEEDEKKYRASY